ncbi:EpsG family protein [Candidatus Pseudoruminococcus sp.]|uniref:EpsG family protein n=1 Tax=Candidatus Pseudoruminococcus sp. TaxID=3101048 RepID=UPI00399A54EE|nr:EpsG family protein [Ruminococcus sp.]
MLIYHLNNLLILVWAVILCFHKPSKAKNMIFLFLAFGQLYLLTIFRFLIGYDYVLYAKAFMDLQTQDFWNFTYYDWEYGFVLITKLLGMILPSYTSYFAVIAIFTLIPVAIFIYRNTEKVWIGTFMYINFFLFFMQMNFIRQAIAVSITLLAWQFIKKKKFFWFLLIILFASLFHSTVLVMIPFYFITKMRPTGKQVIFYGYALTVFYFSSTGILNLITKIFHQEYNNTQFINEGISLIYAVVPIIILVFTLLNAEKMLKTNPNNRYIISMVFAGTFFMVIMAKHSILERFSYYFFIYIALLVPELISSVEKYGFGRVKNNAMLPNETPAEDVKRFKRQSNILTIVILVLSYSIFTYGMFKNAHGVIPYTSWTF